MPACSKCGFESERAFKFCPECGAEPAAAAPSREHRKIVTVLFCDLTGSTALGETLDPERLRALLARYFERMKAIVERHGGSVEKFIGDAVMAVFGVPALHEDDALRAVRSAVEMRDALPELELQGRIGVMTGEVVTGTEERLATGDAVNVAARLEQAAQPGEVLIGQPTLALVRDAADVEPVGPLELKGKAEPVPAYRLLRVNEAPERRHEALFVGRERELALVRDAWELVQAEQRCELVTIVGDPGVGKTRLSSEVLASLEATVVRGRCLPYGEGITYWPVVEVLKQLHQLPSDEAAAAAIRSLLGETEAATSADEIAWAFRKTLEQAAAERPLVVVFDDIHWGEETFLDLIEHVALLSSGASILLLCIARRELTERRPAWPVTLRLEPLGDDDVDELIPERIAGELREKIARAAGGNPLFIGEMLAMAGEAEGEVVVPPTLQALLAARLDQLETAERSVLERGAIEGEIFHRGAVQALAPEETQVTPRLAALVRKELIRPDKPQLAGEDGFRFRHLLIRDAAYDALPKAVRADLHERFASWLERKAGDRVAEFEEILGYHLEHAYRYRAELGPVDEPTRAIARRAAQWLSAAGRRALAHWDVSATVKLLSRAVELLPPGDPFRLEVLPDLGIALAQSDIRRADAVLTEAIAAARTTGDRLVEARAGVRRVFVRLLLDPQTSQQGSLREVERYVGLFEEWSDDIGLAEALTLIGTIRFWQGRAAAAEENLERANAHARRAGSRRQEAETFRWLALVISEGPTPAVEGIRRLESIVDEGRGDRRVEMIVTPKRAQFEAMLGRFELARELIAHAKALARELGDQVALAAVLRDSGGVEMLGADPMMAETEIRAGYEILDRIGDIGHLSSFAPELGDAVYEQGRYDEALRLSEFAERITIEGDVDAEVRWRQLRGKTLARRGRYDEAEALAGKAVRLAARTDYLDLHAHALLGLAEVLRLAERKSDASTAVREALELYHRKGNTVEEARAASLLAELKV